MRPLRIELEGFAAFRSPTVVDLTDADLFAFVGATGSGKSSVIDGMIFALYGSVPRYNNDNLVHPVITQGKPEARVRLDFELGGVEYTAVRVVRRTKTGASTKEARLECGSEVLASDAGGVQAAVTELVGLDLGQFTKCVVLPQGAFAQLLHDTSSQRQDLLVKLLDFGVYEQVARAARSRAQQAEGRIAGLDGQLAELAAATDEAVAAAGRRVVATEEVLASLDEFESAVAEIDDDVRRLTASVADADRALETLARVEVPAGVDDVAAAATRATEALTVAERAEAEAAAAVAEAEAAAARAGDPKELAGGIAAHAEVERLTGAVAKGDELVAERRRDHVVASGALARAETADAEARARLEACRVEHAAADLAQHLHPGDPCPVCGSAVDVLPEHRADALAQAQADAASAGDVLARARRALTEVEAQLRSFETKLDERREQHAAAVAEVAGLGTVEELRAAQAVAETALTELDAARRRDKTARAATAQARAAHADARAAEQAGRTAYAATRDAVAAFGPPAPGDDLAADWAALLSWRDREAASRREAADAERRELERRRAARTEAVRAAVARAEAAGVTVVGDRVRDAVVAAVTDARQRRDQLEAQRERAATLRAERDELAAERGVYDLLGKELQPRRFEAWLLEEALSSLVAGASERLEQLSSGRYAMALDDKSNFEVIDHANADERRLARTLSGGETFLASLALALALAERVSELSATGQRSLDAIFLDEGFGTLDPETLDVVACAIEELGASGRMVGVISHVRELAERVPVRFEVRRGPETSTVTRVDA